MIKNNLRISTKTVVNRKDRQCGICNELLPKGSESLTAYKTDGFITKYAGSYHTECWKNNEGANIVNIGKNK